MRLGEKGFAVTSIIYSMLVLFLALVLLIMSNLANRKVLFDKEKNEILSKLNESISELCVLVSGEAYALGSEYICNPGDGNHTFYVLENNETSENISLIMDRNFPGTIAWCGDVTRCQKNGLWSIEFGPITALEELEEKTSEWTNPKIVSIDLPTGQQIANAGRASYWTDQSTSDSSLLANPWLYGNLDNDGSSQQKWGYWTSTSYNNANNARAWIIFYDATISTTPLSSNEFIGIRPVITVPKSSI